MSRSVLISGSEKATHDVGMTLAPLLADGDVILLSGDLGAGKTALVKGIAEGLGVTEPITSPTFNILLVHKGRVPLYHIDLYRLESASQLEDIDYFGILEADGVSVVEWGDRFAEAMPPTYIMVRIEIVGEEQRRLTITASGMRGEELAVAWFDVCASLGGIEIQR